MLASQPDCLLARMTGSGATIFGLFEDEAAASHARQTLYKATPSWWMTVTRLLGA